MILVPNLPMTGVRMSFYTRKLISIHTPLFHYWTQSLNKLYFHFLPSKLNTWINKHDYYYEIIASFDREVSYNLRINRSSRCYCIWRQLWPLCYLCDTFTLYSTTLFSYRCNAQCRTYYLLYFQIFLIFLISLLWQLLKI